MITHVKPMVLMLMLMLMEGGGGGNGGGGGAKFSTPSNTSYLASSSLTAKSRLATYIAIYC